MGRKKLKITELNECLGESVLRLLKEQGSSQARLSERSGVSDSRISELTRNLRLFTLTDIEAIATGLSIKPSQLVAHAERLLDERSKRADNVVDFPRAQEENLPDFTKLAARKVTTRPEWEARRALDDIGEENQIDPYELD
nr:MAG TPA_asm: conjugal transfer protein [Caudoviricetes sp.]